MSKKPVYDQQEPDVVIAHQPSSLEAAVRRSRIAVSDKVTAARAVLQTGVDKWITVEDTLRHKAQGLWSPIEPILPGLLYVTVGAFAGVLSVRRHHSLVRFATGTTAGVVVFGLVYPKTSATVFQTIQSSLASTTTMMQKKSG